jgi:phosphoribosylanthranilate isomerase
MRVEIWKALGLSDRQTLINADRFRGAADMLLYDAPAQALPGGTGTRVDWSLLRDYEHRIPWGLAGGLAPDNVAEALRITKAPLVDVSSGVESAPGVKDVDKIAAFCKAVREYAP